MTSSSWMLPSISSLEMADFFLRNVSDRRAAAARARLEYVSLSEVSINCEKLEYSDEKLLDFVDCNKLLPSFVLEVGKALLFIF